MSKQHTEFNSSLTSESVEKSELWLHPSQLIQYFSIHADLLRHKWRDWIVTKILKSKEMMCKLQKSHAWGLRLGMQVDLD